MEPPRKYWAFLSYSHRDGQAATWLHRALERYRIPRRLRVGRNDLPARLHPVFRDRDELPTAGDLGVAIERALDESSCLVVLCSPHAAASRWVNEEVRRFQSTRGQGRVLAVILDGEPNASDKPELGAAECFPPALRFRTGPGDARSGERIEPVAADLRPGRDSPRQVLLRVVAGVLGVAYDDLRQRDVERQRRARWARAGIAALGLALAVAGWRVLEDRRERDVAQTAEAGDVLRRREVSRERAAKYEQRGREAAERGDVALAAAYLAESYANERKTPVLRSSLRWLQELALPLVSIDHGAAIVSAAFHPDATRFATMNDDGNVRVWDAATGAPVAQLDVDHDTYAFRTVTFTRDGSRLFTAAENARFWDATTGAAAGPPIPFRPIVESGVDLSGSRVTESSTVEDAALRPADERVVLRWSSGDVVEVWDGTTARRVEGPTPGAGHQPSYAYLSQASPIPEFSPDGSLRVRWQFGEPVRVTRTSGGKDVATLDHDGAVTCVRFSHDGRSVASGGSDAKARLWALDGSERVRTLSHADPLSALAFSPDDRHLVTASGTTATLWSRAGEREMVMSHRSVVRGVEVSRSGTRVLTWCEDGTASVWDLEHRTTALPRALRRPEWDESTLVALDASGRRLLLRGRRSNDPRRVELWDVDAGVLLWRIASEAGVAAAWFGPDGRTLATLDEGDGLPAVRLRDAATGATVGAPSEGGEGRSGGDSSVPGAIVAFRADGTRWMLVRNRATSVPGGLTLSATVDEFDAKTNAPARPRRSVPNDRVPCCGYLPDGRALVGVGGALVRLADDAAELPSDPWLRVEGLRTFAVSPDGTRLLALGREHAVLVDVTTAAPIGVPLPIRQGTVAHAAFSPDGKLAAASVDGVVRVWDVAERERVGEDVVLASVPDHSHAPRFVDATRLRGVSSAALIEMDFSWALKTPSPQELSRDAESRSLRRVGAAGEPELLSKSQGLRRRDR